MPEELKSLNVVLDMKNEELKTLRSKTMELERKVTGMRPLVFIEFNCSNQLIIYFLYVIQI